jgi:acetyltransferase-like isoleucine patch superfamily enzyme
MLRLVKKIIKQVYLKIKFRKKKIIFLGLSDIALNSFFEGYNKIANDCSFAGSIGYGSYIGGRSRIYGKIGRFCSIAENVTVISATHPMKDFVSTHPSFYSIAKQNGMTYVKSQIFKEFLFADKENKFPVIIGNDVWIGNGATVIGGITIGEGAVILANSTVTKDVKPYSIVAGLPAKEIGKRFNDETIAFLLEFKWWNRSDDWLKENAGLFSNINNFLQKYENQYK